MKVWTDLNTALFSWSFRLSDSKMSRFINGQLYRLDVIRCIYLLVSNYKMLGYQTRKKKCEGISSIEVKSLSNAFVVDFINCLVIS